MTQDSATARPARPPDEAHTGFTRQPMVQWFDPLQLEKTVMPVYISELFGAYADKREMMAALDPPPPTVYDEFQNAQELWLDFVADLGDGWDSTYSVAYLLSRSVLNDTTDTPWLARDDGKGDEAGPPVLPRGRILVMGGDQVYPVANRDEYQNRLVGPYGSALPEMPDGVDPPRLFAIPGNHDWYDGLRSFLRLFCQQRTLGAWKTQQTRSYWAIKLPYGWWLWGTDIQLQTDIDRPQLEYFKGVAAKQMQPGDRVILCTAGPSWVKTSRGETEAYHNLLYFEHKIIRANQGVLAATLTGDLHCYARYADAKGERPKIVAGGGGAFLYPTHDLPGRLELEIDDDDRVGDVPHESYALVEGSRFPDATTSSGYVLRNLWFVWTNRRFSYILLAPLYLLLMWSIQSASIAVSTEQHECRRIADSVGTRATPSASPCIESIRMGRSVMDEIRNGPPEHRTAGYIARYVTSVLTASPGTMVLVLVVVIGFGIFAASERAGRAEDWKVRFIGWLHGLLHVTAVVFLMWAFAHLALSTLGPSDRIEDAFPALARSLGALPIVSHILTILALVLYLALLVVACGTLAGTIVGTYLVITHKVPMLRMHTQEVFSSQAIPDYKNYLRLRVTASDVTIYAIGIPRVCRKWSFVKSTVGADPWYRPDEPIAWRLIEEVVISRDGGAQVPPSLTTAADRVRAAAH